MNKIILIVGVCLLLVSAVAVIIQAQDYKIKWSNPSVGFPEPTLKPETHKCSNEEWNSYFSDYRSGILTKEEALIKLRSCDRW